MLYDASWARNLAPEWFDPRFWAANGAIQGEARGRGTALFVNADGRQLVLRHYRRGGLFRQLLRDRYLWFGARRTRPFHEWYVTYQLRRHGLPAPVPVGARFVRRGVFYSGDLLTVAIPGARSLAQRLGGDGLSITDWVAVGRCLRRFHDFGLCHADLNAHNILFDAHDEVHVIDFDRCSLRRPGLWSDANLVRLRRSLLKITDPLPAGRFTETEWQSLLAGYAEAARRPAAADA